MKTLNTQKFGQVGIFVVIAIILIILFVFILSTSNSDKLTNVKNSNTDLDNSQGELFPLKTSIDTCLENELKIATIVAGLKGGLIYEDSEKFTENNGVDYYNENVLKNLKLNPNYLTRNLIHAQYDVLMPKYNSTLIIDKNGVDETIYSHTIEEDFKRFILFNLNKCLNFNEQDLEGYKITQNIFFGNLITFDADSQTIESTHIDAELGDTTSFVLDGKLYYGVVIKNNPGENTISLLHEYPFTSQTTLGDIIVLNLNNTVELDMLFEDEKVATKLVYPIILEKNNKKVYFKGTQVEIQNRFKKIMDFGSFILSKKQFDRSIDLTDATQLKTIVSQNPFYNQLDAGELEFNILTTSDEIGHKEFSLSIIDNKFKLFTNPFVFNFGYENHAPRLIQDTSASFYSTGLYNPGGSILNPDSFYYVIPKTKSVTLELNKLLHENEFFDTFKNNFLSYTDNTLEYRFELTEGGTLKFTGREDGVYNFNVEVTDGENSNIYKFVFDIGLTSEYNPLDYTNYNLFYLDSYTDGNPYLFFTQEYGYTGNINTASKPTINMVSDYISNMPSSDLAQLPTHYRGLKIKTTYTDDNFNIEEIGSETAAFIYRPVKELIDFSQKTQTQFILTKNLPKTSQYIIANSGSFASGLIVDIQKIADTSTRKEYKIKFSYPNYLDVNSNIITTEFDYLNHAPILSNTNPITISGINISNSSKNSKTHSISRGSDIDKDQLFFNSTSTDSQFSISNYGIIYFRPNSAGTYTYQVWQSDGEFETQRRTITYNVVS